MRVLWVKFAYFALFLLLKCALGTNLSKDALPPLETLSSTVSVVFAGDRGYSLHTNGSVEAFYVSSNRLLASYLIHCATYLSGGRPYSLPISSEIGNVSCFSDFFAAFSTPLNDHFMLFSFAQGFVLDHDCFYTHALLDRWHSLANGSLREGWTAIGCAIAPGRLAVLARSVSNGSESLAIFQHESGTLRQFFDFSLHPSGGRDRSTAALPAPPSLHFAPSGLRDGKQALFAGRRGSLTILEETSPGLPSPLSWIHSVDAHAGTFQPADVPTLSSETVAWDTTLTFEPIAGTFAQSLAVQPSSTFVGTGLLVVGEVGLLSDSGDDGDTGRPVVVAHLWSLDKEGGRPLFDRTLTCNLPFPAFDMRPSVAIAVCIPPAHPGRLCYMMMRARPVLSTIHRYYFCWSFSNPSWHIPSLRCIIAPPR